jgi:hypothetical protein
MKGKMSLVARGVASLGTRLLASRGTGKALGEIMITISVRTNCSYSKMGFISIRDLYDNK